MGDVQAAIIPVDQTCFGKGKGNCLAACVASLTGLPLDELTVALGQGDGRGEPEHWMDRAIRVMRDYGYQVLYDTSAPFAGYNIAMGPAERGLRHAVVTLDGTLAHDPHPSRAGLIEAQSYIALQPLSRLLGTTDNGGVDG